MLILVAILTATVMNEAGKFTPELGMIMVWGLILLGFVSLIGITFGFFGTLDRSSKKVCPVLASSSTCSWCWSSSGCS
jgi:hypothetical protein